MSHPLASTLREARQLSIGDTIIVPDDVVVFPAIETVTAKIRFITSAPGKDRLLLRLVASDHMAYTVVVSETERVETVTRKEHKKNRKT